MTMVLIPDLARLLKSAARARGSGYENFPAGGACFGVFILL